jgi:tetratricopeptide (TPR) repeat protein
MAGLLLTSLVVTTAMTSVAHAQETEPSAEAASGAEARMIAENEAGFSAFAEGDFAEAARKFEQAHSYVPDPILRKNAAIAWFKADHCPEASEAAVFFLLADEMSARDRVEARSVLGHCRLEQAETALERGDVQRAQAIVERVAFLETDERVEARLVAVRMQLSETGAGSREQISGTETAGWALVAGGAAILAGNVGYHLVSDSSTSEWLVPTLYGVGGVAVGSGLWVALSADPVRPGSGQSRTARIQETQKPAALRAPASGMHLNLALKF